MSNWTGLGIGTKNSDGDWIEMFFSEENISSEALELSDDVTQFLRLNLTNKQVANKFFEILSSNEIPNLIMEEAKSIEQTDSETYEE